MQDEELAKKNSDSSQDLDNKSVARSAFKVSLGGFLGLILGFGTQIAIASLFGAGPEMDAYLTALAIPLYLQAVLLSGLSFVFIPAFVKNRTLGREDDAWALVGTFFWLTLGILLIIVIVITFLASDIITLSAPELSPEKNRLTAKMLSVLIFAVPFSGLSSLTRGVQNARRRFFWPATAAALGSIANLLTLLLLYQTTGPMALVWGYLAFTAVGACITVIPVLQHGWPYVVPLNDEQVRKMAKLIMPFILFGILTKASPLLERYFASGLPDGDLSYLGYADKISRIFNGILAGSIATVIFPVMSQAYVKDSEAGLVRTFKYGLRLTVAVGLPVLAIMSAVAIPFVTVLFERGAFQSTATLQVSRIVPLKIMAMVLIPMIGNLLARSFYVTEDTRTVPIVSTISVVIYISLAGWLADLWGYVGLAVAQMFYAAIGSLVLVVILLRKLNSFKAGRILRSLFLYGIASLITFFSAWFLTRTLASSSAIVQLVIGGGVSALLYMIILFQIDAVVARAILEMVGIQHVLRLRVVKRVLGTIRFDRPVDQGIL